MVEGRVAHGERVEVELRVAGAVVARAARGDALSVSTGDAEVALDVSALALDGVEAETRRGAWRALAAHPEAALVADRAPAPHVAAELTVRRLGPGAEVAIEGEASAHGFAEGTTNREPA
ncbi:MAG: hypothetical protein KF729_32420, partial [Sandaracinaceae bacterium]|nr:hypothetical protein [Sandaracinaceae bacterium]